MKQILFLFIAIIFATNTKADEVKFTASAPKVVEVGEQFRLTYSVNAKGTSLKVPDFDGFEILMGPSTSQSSSTRIINGQVSSSVNFSYSYVLMAEKEGRYTLNPAEIKVKGHTFTSNTVIIEVVKAGKKPASASGNNTNNTAPRNKITDKNLFLKVSVNRRSVYMGQRITATIKVYTRVNIAGFGASKFPAFDGFLSQEIPTPNQISLQRENVNGVIYNVGTIRKLNLFPQHTGKITIDPFELECIVRQERRGGGSGFFDDFFNNYQDVKVSRKSKPLTITVKDFPANKPASFNGAVGNLSMKATIDKNSVKANDAVTLRVKISGNGNLKLINAPEFDFPADFETYDPTSKQNFKNSAQGMTGSVTFEYLIIPRHAGEYTIPPTRFSYFNPATEEYKTLATPKFTIKVEESKNGNANNTIISSLSKEDVKFIGKDIRYIKTNKFTPRIKGTYFFGTFYFYLGYLIPLVLFFVIFMVYRKKIRENADVVRMKNKRANRVAMKRLKAAAARLKAKQKEQFYDEILKALWGYTSDKLSLPLADLNKENINEILLNKGVEQDLIDEFLDILNTCEFARYAPASGTSEMDELYKKTMKTISKLERNV